MHPSLHSVNSRGFDPLGLLDPVNSGGFVNPEWLKYSEVCLLDVSMQICDDVFVDV